MPHGPVPALVRPGAPLVGRLRAPGDGSDSQIALVLALLSVGAVTIEGLAENEETLRTAAACAALGARVTRLEPGLWRVAGVGVGGVVTPATALDAGGSGLAAALLAGVLGAHPVTGTIDGDTRLRARSAAPIAEPLARMGAALAIRGAHARLPLTLTGPQETIPLVHDLASRADDPDDAAGAVAVLLAGLNSPGRITVIAPAAALSDVCGALVRLLRLLGAPVSVAPHGAGSVAVSLQGQPELRATRVVLPADPFLAACAVVAALIAPGSDVTLPCVPAAFTDGAVLPLLREMGADIAVSAERSEGGAPVADLRVRAGRLAGIAVAPAHAAVLGDAVPLLAIAAGFAAGETRIDGLPDENGRLAGLCAGLAAAGVDITRAGDALVVRGAGAPPAGGARISADADPRLALAFAVLGLGARGGATLADARPVTALFPTFASLLRGLGADFEETARWAS